VDTTGMLLLLLLLPSPCGAAAGGFPPCQAVPWCVILLFQAWECLQHVCCPAEHYYCAASGVLGCHISHICSRGPHALCVHTCMSSSHITVKLVCHPTHQVPLLKPSWCK